MNKKVPSDLNFLARTIKKQIAPSKLYSIIQFYSQLVPLMEKYLLKKNLISIILVFKWVFKRNSLDAIKNQFVKQITLKKYDKKTLDSLNVLGLKGGATKEEIKIAYEI